MEKILPLGKASKYEEELLQAGLPELKASIDAVRQPVLLLFLARY